MVKSEVVGLFHYSRTARRVHIGDFVDVTFEPSNTYDANAILVRHNGATLGHIPRYMQKTINPAVAAKHKFMVTFIDILGSNYTCYINDVPNIECGECIECV